MPRRGPGTSGGIPLGGVSLANTTDERRLIDLDQRIHRHVYRCTHNPFLVATLEEYYVPTLRIWFLALDRVARLYDAVREHHAILEAICDRDPDHDDDSGAGTRARRHRKRAKCTVRANPDSRLCANLEA